MTFGAIPSKSPSMTIEQYRQLAAKPKNKFGAKRTTLGSKTFDSKAEARRYSELLLLERAGTITALECQPVYPLILNGVPIKDYRGVVRKFKGDFRYVKDGLTIIEDVKGKDNPMSRFKRDVFHACYPHLRVEIVK
jgi:hypothetical protein